MNMKDFSLDGKIAFITGATYGIGFAIATAYINAGAKVAFCDISQDKVDAGYKAYEEAGFKDSVKGYVCNVTDEAQVKDTIAKIKLINFCPFTTSFKPTIA